MKPTQLILSGLAGIALTLAACKSETQTDATPSNNSTPSADATPAGEMQTVSLNVKGMT